MLKVENLIKNTPSRLHYIHNDKARILQNAECLQTRWCSFLANFKATAYELGPRKS